jgi:hypothetical protein
MISLCAPPVRMARQSEHPQAVLRQVTRAILFADFGKSGGAMEKTTSPIILLHRKQFLLQALYRFIDENRTSLDLCGERSERYAEMMGGNIFASHVVIISKSHPDLHLEIRVDPTSNTTPFHLEFSDPADMDGKLSRQAIGEYERIRELVDRLNALHRISELTTTPKHDATPGKRITAIQKDKQERQERIKKYCKQGMSIAEMAQSESVSDTTIKRDLKDLGLTTRQ